MEQAWEVVKNATDISLKMKQQIQSRRSKTLDEDSATDEENCCDVESLLNRKHTYGQRDRFILAWFFLVEKKVWLDGESLPPFELKWSHTHLTQLSHLSKRVFVKLVSLRDYYRILTYLIHDRITKDHSFYQGHEQFAHAFQENRLFGVYLRRRSKWDSSDSCDSKKMVGLLVGYAVTKIQLEKDGNKTLWITYYEVFPPYRKRGIGKQGLRLLEGITKRVFGCTQTSLEPTTSACAFYRKSGFQIKRIYHQVVDLTKSSDEEDLSDESDDDFDLQATRAIQ